MELLGVGQPADCHVLPTKDEVEVVVTIISSDILRWNTFIIILENMSKLFYMVNGCNDQDI